MSIALPALHCNHLRSWPWELGESCATLCACEAGGQGVDDSRQSRVKGGCAVTTQDTKVSKFVLLLRLPSDSSVRWAFGSVSVSAPSVQQLLPLFDWGLRIARPPMSAERPFWFCWCSPLHVRDARWLPGSGRLRRAPSSVAKQRVCRHLLARQVKRGTNNPL